MDNNKNFISWYIMRIIITIIDIVISLNSTTGTKIVKTRWKNFTDVNNTFFNNYGNIVLPIIYATKNFSSISIIMISIS